MLQVGGELEAQSVPDASDCHLESCAVCPGCCECAIGLMIVGGDEHGTL